MSFLVWRGPEPTRALSEIRYSAGFFNAKKNAPTKPSADGWWGRGAPSGVDSTHRLLYHRLRVCQLENNAGKTSETGHTHCGA